MYVCSLSILRKPRNGLSYESLLETVEQRLPQIPRYRQKVREVTLRPGPAGVGRRPRLRHHLSHPQVSAAVPGQRRAAARTRRAGWGRARWTRHGRCGRCTSSKGWPDNRLAIYTKSHQALVNGMTALEIGHVIADRTQKPPTFGEDIWIPAREPGDAR